MMRLEMQKQASFSRGQLLLRTFFGSIYLVFPHAIFLLALAIVAKVYHIYGVFHILLKGELPKSVYDYQVKFLKHASRVHIHIYNLVDGYPLFDLNQENELFDFHIDYEPHPDRLSVLLRFVLGGFYVWLPHGLIWFFRNLVNSFLLIVAFWVVLFTGKYPQRLFDFQIGTLRWLVRVYAYDWNLTHEYPPFSGKP